MTDQLFQSITVVLTGILGVAILAVIVSKNAQTDKVLTAGGSAFSNMLGTALSPVSMSGGYGFSGMTMPTVPGWPS